MGLDKVEVGGSSRQSYEELYASLVAVHSTEVAAYETLANGLVDELIRHVRGGGEVLSLLSAYLLRSNSVYL